MGALHSSRSRRAVAAYLLPHFLNHMAAQWTVELNVQLMKVFRQWYLSSLFEPVLLVAGGIPRPVTAQLFYSKQGEFNG